MRASLAGVDLAGSRVATDRLRSYIRPLRAAGVAAHNRYNAKEAGEDELGMVNALHSRLRGFLSRFNRALFAEPRPFWGYWRRPPVMDIDSLYPPEVISGVV